ncbi:MAG: MmcQ/YjbR family DNA-binding protein [Pyrinomonadaceae bacterium]
MMPDEFRTIALSFPEAVESAHMGHPDFRVGGKIFATLGPDGDWGMAKLNAEQQAWFLTNEPETFKPAAGAWGKGGATIITLELAEETSVRRALNAAWRNTAPKKLIKSIDEI